MKVPDITLVILCFKSGEFAQVFYDSVVRVLEKNFKSYEIIMVANYWDIKNDSTPMVVKKIAALNKNVKIVVKKKKASHQNMGWDMKTGLRAAQGKVIGVIDGDGQINPNDIIRLYKKLQKESLDICKAKRIRRNDGLYRNFISMTYNLLMQVLFPGIAGDLNGKPKIFTRSAYSSFNLKSNDWFIDAEIMIKAKRHSLKVGEVGSTFYKRQTGSSNITFKENLEFLKNIFIWRFLNYKQ